MWFWPVNEMIELVSGTPAPQFRDECNFAYLLRCLRVSQVWIPLFQINRNAQRITNKCYNGNYCSTDSGTWSYMYRCWERQLGRLKTLEIASLKRRHSGAKWTVFTPISSRDLTDLWHNHKTLVSANSNVLYDILVRSKMLGAVCPLPHTPLLRGA
jgi:hypothetical protein